MTEETIFIAALEKGNPAERAAFLEVACAENPGLRQRIEALLASHNDVAFLRKPAVERPIDRPASAEDDARTSPTALDGADSLDFLEPSAKPGSIGKLGHYEVNEIIGRGGMGVV